MSLTLIVLVVTLLFSSVVGIVTLKKSARQRAWLEEIEAGKSERLLQSQGRGNHSRPSVGA